MAGIHPSGPHGTKVNNVICALKSVCYDRWWSLGHARVVEVAVGSGSSQRSDAVCRVRGGGVHRCQIQEREPTGGRER